MKTIACLTALLLVPLATLHAAPHAAKKSQAGDDTPAGKAYTYKESAGKSRQIEVLTFRPTTILRRRRCPG